MELMEVMNLPLRKKTKNRRRSKHNPKTRNNSKMMMKKLWWDLSSCLKVGMRENFK